jgi:hypothetical protein
MVTLPWIALICFGFLRGWWKARASRGPPTRWDCRGRRCRRRFPSLKRASVRGCFIAPRAASRRPMTVLAFYQRCVRLIGEVEEAEALFRRGTDGLVGKVKIDMPGRIGRLIVAPALPEFLALHPHIEVELGVTDRAINLVEENVDGVLRVGPACGFSHDRAADRRAGADQCGKPGLSRTARHAEITGRSSFASRGEIRVAHQWPH